MLELLTASLLQIAANNPGDYPLFKHIESGANTATINYMCYEMFDLETEEKPTSHALDAVCSLIWSLQDVECSRAEYIESDCQEIK